MNKEAALKDFLLELHEKASILEDRELYDYALDGVVSLSGSAIGFFHLISEDQTTVYLTTWNREALKNCNASYDVHYPLDLAGNWVDCVRLKRPVVYNDFRNSPNQKGLPEGHTPVLRFMSVPLLEGDRIRVIFGVGNKAEEYNNGDIAMVQVIANDLQRIIGQRRAEKALRSSEAYFRALIENASDMIGILDEDGTICYSSPSVERILGYTPAELNGRNAFGLVHRDDLPTVMDAFTHAIQHPNESVHKELRFLHKGGSWRVLEVMARSLPENEAIKGIIVNSHDVTVRKMAEDDLIWERNHLKTLLEFYRQPDTQILDITAFAVEQCILISESPLGFLGLINEDETLMTAHLWSEQAMKGCAIDLKPVEFSITHAGIWAEAIRMHAPLIVNDYLRPDPRKKGYPEGHVPIRRLMSIPIIKGGKAVAIMAVANKEQEYSETDILHLSLFLESAWDAIARKKAEEKIKGNSIRLAKANERLLKQIILRKQAETERRRSEQRLQQVHKAESLGRMAGAIAHHFNNLLGAVMGNLELAGMDLPEGSKINANIAGAMSASRRAADISRLMLAYLGQSVGAKAPIELSEVCREVLALIAPSLPKTVRLQTELPDWGLTIRADAIQIKEALTNLLVNATEALGDKGGNVTVTVRETFAADIRAPRFYPPEWEPKDGGYACLSILDTGEGMDTTTLERAFDPFFSTKFPGRGLGLPVALGVIKAHNGAVAVESSPGQGTVIRVFLPLLPGKPSPRKMEPVEAAPPGNRGVALLVEDEPMFRKMLEIMLNRMGYEVVAVSDGIGALEILRARKGKIGCVILNLSMPRMDGWEALAEIRAIHADLPVILTSGHEEAKMMWDSSPQERRLAFLPKPFQMKELEAAICEARKDSIAENQEA